ncbi:PREDICTED: squalene synthase-like [Brassica oleracea var. oleracea]|uniref:Squalene synthase n=1 Tax=Brassica oleracea var. oleracea TaxID=109376 RepID=A0A0D3BIB1_BRAOL|nr:PREDICTED: squalene synthase-like [Brassica oleracea var. oleracea]
MGSLSTILRHPDEIYPLLKLKLAITKAQKQIPLDPHLTFCYSTLNKVSKTFSLIIQQLGTELRDAVCLFYLILRALDTVEDDTSIPTEIKVPILIAFHRHIYDRDWHFVCGEEKYKVLMEQFHHVSAAFLELEKGYQEIIEDITKRMGAGMAKFISKEVCDTLKSRAGIDGMATPACLLAGRGDGDGPSDPGRGKNPVGKAARQCRD